MHKDIQVHSIIMDDRDDVDSIRQLGIHGSGVLDRILMQQNRWPHRLAYISFNDGQLIER